MLNSLSRAGIVGGGCFELLLVIVRLLWVKDLVELTAQFATTHSKIHILKPKKAWANQNSSTLTSQFIN
jgi:hypothetical protein